MLTLDHTLNALSFARRVLGFQPNALQQDLLLARDRYVILNCHRQWGKTTMTAVYAVHRAMTRPGQSIVILSLTVAQAQILAERCKEFAQRAGLRWRKDPAKEHGIAFPNGSVIFPLPAMPDRVRGYTANLLIVDEAATIRDEIFTAATPMLTATNGDLWLLSTPQEPRGFFYEAWVSQDRVLPAWRRIAATAETSGRVSGEVLRRERGWKTEEEFRREYAGEFASGERTVFLESWLDAAFTDDFGRFDELSRANLHFQKYPTTYCLSKDVGKVANHATLVLLELSTTYTGKRDPVTWQYLYRPQLRLVLAERFRLGTEYRKVVARAAQLCRHPNLAGRTSLLLDASGAGLPIEEWMQEEKLPVNFLPVTITGGGNAHCVNGRWHVPKAQMVRDLITLLEGERLKISNAIPHADLLREELRQFEKRSACGGGRRLGRRTGGRMTW